MPSHYLSLMGLLPILGAGLVAWAPQRWIRALSVSVACGGLALAAPLWFVYNPGVPEFQFLELVSGTGVLQYAVGVDGISVVFLLATAVLGICAAVALPSAPARRVRAWSATLLLAQAGTTGGLISLDVLLFTVCWAVTVAALVRLAALSREDAGVRDHAFLVSAVLSVAALLWAIVAVAGNPAVGGGYSFDLQALQALSVPVAGQWWSFGAFLVAFGLSVPLFLLPLGGRGDGRQAWAIPGSVLLALGCYGLLRVTLPLLPEASRAAAWGTSLAALAGVIIIGVFALLETDTRRVVGWLSAMMTTLGMAGIFALTPDSLAGTVLQQAVRAIGTGGLLLLCDLARQSSVSDPGGAQRVRVWPRAAIVATALMLMMLAAGLAPRLLHAGAAARGTGTVVVLAVGIGIGVLTAGRFAWLTLLRRSAGDVPAGVGATGLHWVVAIPALAAVLGAVAAPASVVERITVPALKVAARIDAAYTGAFEAACDPTVTEEMKAANPANQFLTAAPCGPNGEPLPSPSTVLPSSAPVQPR